MAVINLEPKVDEYHCIRGWANKHYVASNFKPALARAIFNEFGNQGTVLDFSAGFGGRFVGFYSSTCSRYIGIDPNLNSCALLHENVGIREKRVPRKTKRRSFLSAPAESIDYAIYTGHNQVDCIFTSPPYADTERYASDVTQSWRRYGTVEEWKERFLFTVVRKLYACLKPNGTLAINIADSEKLKIRVCDDLCRFAGAIGFEILPARKILLNSRPGNPSIKAGRYCLAEPVWLFRKR